MAYGYARVSNVQVTVTASATLKLCDLGSWYDPCTAYGFGFPGWARVGLDGVNASYVVDFGTEVWQQTTGPPFDIQTGTNEIWTFESFTMAPGLPGEIILDSNTNSIGSVWTNVWPTTNDPVNWANNITNTNPENAATVSIGPFDLYKKMDDSELPFSANGPNDPTHPLHYAMRYGWAPASNCTASCNTDNMSSSTNYAWHDPYWDLPSGLWSAYLSHNLGVHSYSNPNPVQRVSEANTCRYSALDGGTGSPVFDTNVSTTDGKCVATNDLVYTELTNSTANLDPPTLSLSLARYADVIVTYNIDISNWAVDFDSIPIELISNDGVTVYWPTTPISNLKIVYKEMSWTNVWNRITSFQPTVSNSWAQINSEDVVPPSLEGDRRLIIEECGTSNGIPAAGSFWDWGYFQGRRRPTLPVHVPWWTNDFPSVYVAADAGVQVIETLGGTNVEIRVDPSATSSIVTRDLSNSREWFLSTNTGEGVATFGLPTAYKLMGHTNYRDCENWSSYGFLRLDYHSEQTTNLTFALTNRNYTISDDHMTGSERISNFAYTTADTHYRYPISVVTGSNQVLYIDLQTNVDVFMEAVQVISFEGFKGTASTWTFQISNLQLVQYNPTSATEAGKVDHKIGFLRPDEDELPVSYIGLSAGADGYKTLVIPDREDPVTGEQGFDYCEYLRGRVTGVIMDEMYAISAWYQWLSNYEGFEVRDFGEPYGTSSNAYSNAFADTSNNDMLPEGIKTGFCADAMDLPIATSNSGWTILPVRPRVGKVYLMAGTNIGCNIRHVHHGSLQSLARTNNLTRNLNATTYVLWQGYWSTASNLMTNITKIAETNVDPWGRMYFPSQAGYKEESVADEWRGALWITNSNPPTNNQDNWWETQNRSRRWLTLPIVPSAYEGLSAFLWYGPGISVGRAYPRVRWPSEPAVGTLVTAVDSWYPPNSLELTATTNAYSNPEVLHTLYGETDLVVDDPSLPGLRYLRGRDALGRWQTAVSSLTGYAYPSVCLALASGRVLVTARSISTSKAAVYDTDVTGTWTLRSNDIANQDPAKAAIVQACDGAIYLYVPYNGVIHVYRSRDDGLNWTEV